MVTGGLAVSVVSALLSLTRAYDLIALSGAQPSDFVVHAHGDVCTFCFEPRKMTVETVIGPS
jgi:hypothetical protein